MSLPTTMEITWRNPTDWYDVTSGFQMTKTVVVTIDDSKRRDDAGVVIAGARVSGVLLIKEFYSKKEHTNQ